MGYSKEKYIRNRDQRLGFRQDRKRRVLQHYGKNNELVCCWDGCFVSDLDILTLDHIADNGKAHRDEMGGKGTGGNNTYCLLESQGFPEGYQTLCFNHQWKKELARRAKARCPRSESVISPTILEDGDQTAEGILESVKGVLDRLRASRESQKLSPESSLSSMTEEQIRHVAKYFRDLDISPKNPDEFYPIVGDIPPEGSYWGVVGQGGLHCIPRNEQTPLQSPSVPTELTDTPTPLDQGTEHESGDKSQSEQPDQSSTDSEHQCEHTPGPDQGWIG